MARKSAKKRTTPKKKTQPKITSISGWRRHGSGSKARKRVPTRVFGNKSKRTYPMMLFNRRTGRYEYSKRMLQAGIKRANLNKDKQMSAKLSRILKQRFG